MKPYRLCSTRRLLIQHHMVLLTWTVQNIQKKLKPVEMQDVLTPVTHSEYFDASVVCNRTSKPKRLEELP